MPGVPDTSPSTNTAPLSARSAICRSFVGQWMRAKLRHDLSVPGRVNEATRAVHHVVERFGGRQAGEHHVGLGADIGRRTRRHAANFFELSERAAAVADDA